MKKTWKKYNKICNIVMEGKMFGDVPFHLELKLSVEDSPNSAGVAIDAIRLAKLALDRKTGGVLFEASAFLCKHPPVQYTCFFQVCSMPRTGCTRISSLTLILSW